MVYDLNTELDRERFKRKVNALYAKRSIVECKEYKAPRTDRQNRYIHVLLSEFAMQTGNTISYVKNEYFKRACNPDLFVRKSYDKLLKVETETLRSTRELCKEDMVIAINRFKNWASTEVGIELPDVNNTGWIDYIEREAQHLKVWL